MQLITLNLWGGRIGDQPIKDFFRKYGNAEIFCLQEVWKAEGHRLDTPEVDARLLKKIESYLPDHLYFFRPQYRGIYGPAIFYHKSIAAENEGELFVFKEQGYENPSSLGNHARNIQYVTLQTSRGPVTIINFHGLWNGQGKTDTADRIQQSEKIAGFIRGLRQPFVLAGDFNLSPRTQSMKIVESVCARNLITDFGIVSTRSSLYTKPEKFADYILTSPGVSVSEFEVLPDEVSDHMALRLRFDLEMSAQIAATLPF